MTDYPKGTKVVYLEYMEGAKNGYGTRVVRGTIEGVLPYTYLVKHDDRDVAYGVVKEMVATSLNGLIQLVRQAATAAERQTIQRATERAAAVREAEITRAVQAVNDSRKLGEE